MPADTYDFLGLSGQEIIVLSECLDELSDPEFWDGQQEIDAYNRLRARVESIMATWPDS